MCTLYSILSFFSNCLLILNKKIFICTYYIQTNTFFLQCGLMALLAPCIGHPFPVPARPLHGSQQHPHGAWRTRAGCPSGLSRLSCRFCGSSLFSSWSCPEICGRWSASLASLGGAAAHPLCNLPGAGSPHWTGEWGRDILASSFLGRISSPFMLIIVWGRVL